MWTGSNKNNSSNFLSLINHMVFSRSSKDFPLKFINFTKTFLMFVVLA